MFLYYYCSSIDSDENYVKEMGECLEFYSFISVTIVENAL